MEQQIKIASKLYECRDAVMRLYGPDWKEAISFHTAVIKGAMRKYSIKNEIEAAMKLVDDCKHMDGAGVFTIKIFAAAVQLIEPK